MGTKREESPTSVWAAPLLLLQLLPRGYGSHASKASHERRRWWRHAASTKRAAASTKRDLDSLSNDIVNCDEDGGAVLDRKWRHGVWKGPPTLPGQCLILCSNAFFTPLQVSLRCSFRCFYSFSHAHHTHSRLDIFEICVARRYASWVGAARDIIATSVSAELV